MKRILLLILTLLSVACSAAPTQERFDQVQERIYSQTSTGAPAIYTFTSVAGHTVRFSLWLPPQYDGVTQLPVLYWFHGQQLAGSDPNTVISQVANQVVPQLSSAISTGKIRPTILVIPWAGAASWYVNACNGLWPIEDMIIDELVPHIEANVAALTDGDHRLTGGFSAGAHGALRYYAKHVGMFAGVVAAAAPKADPAIATWNQSEMAAYQAAFCSRPTIFAADAPLTWYQANLPQNTRLIVGGADPTLNGFQIFKNKLVNQLGLAPQWFVAPGVAHSQLPLLQADAGVSFEFYEGLMP